MENYTSEQEQDIKERGQKLMDYLKELELVPAAYLNYANVGDGIFATKVDIRFQDLKFSPKEEKNETQTEDSSPIENTVEA